jgi:hypothetical protein
MTTGFLYINTNFQNLHFGVRKGEPALIRRKRKWRAKGSGY